MASRLRKIQTSELYIQQALAQLDVELDMLVSAYRYYFKKMPPLYADARRILDKSFW